MSATLRGAAYYLFFYSAMAAFGAVFILPALISERAAIVASKGFFHTALFGLRRICGLRLELRGPVPQGEALIACKHQSMLDVTILYAILPRAHFVMKQELLRAPVFGWYAKRVGTVAIDRSAGAEATRAMIAEMTAPGRAPGQIVIFPQGTRVAPGARAPYRTGAHSLYAATGLPCIPAATNTGVFQPKGLAIRPGSVVMAFLDPIPPGLDRAAFMSTLERRVEDASTALEAEAREPA